MLYLLFGITARIFSNSFLNVFQKILTNRGEISSVVNFYTYLGLTIIGLLLCPHPIFSIELIINILIMGLLGALGNYFIIISLSEGDLSELAPINSYKPLIPLLLGIIMLGEVPNIKEVLGIIFVIIGTIVLFNKNFSNNKAVIYRFLALICSGTEAIFIKKIIILSDINSAFLYWAVSGLLFSFIITIKNPLIIKKCNIIYQCCLILMAAMMQYFTNYVFSKMYVAYALALFQLSTIVSVFLGINIFKEKQLKRKLIASLIMISGALLIILN